jgi:phosphatidylglycerol:prolipoprotein diacylglycerol transferase
MLVHPQFDPVALQVGPIAIHWYGLSYLLAFVLFLIVARVRLKHQPFACKNWIASYIDDLLMYGVIGVIVGGRLGYCLFYQGGYYLQNPLEIFAIWKGGMSFHGGLLGVIFAMWYFARVKKESWITVVDFIAPCIPLGLASGRLGNFVNGELWGRITSPDLLWAMVFPQSGSLLPRHPSQIYQALLEGLLLFIILWFYGRKERQPGQIAATFLAGYGILRFIAEFFREPDNYLGILTFGMSMGQWLCVPMVLIGICWWYWAELKQKCR